MKHLYNEPIYYTCISEAIKRKKDPKDPISRDDIINLKIDLKTTKNISEFFQRMGWDLAEIERESINNNIRKTNELTNKLKSYINSLQRYKRRQ